MANSKSNIYPVALQNAELNLNKYDAEIKQYSGFNKNNAPFVGGCLSNIFTKNEVIEGGNTETVYLDKQGNIYKVTNEGLYQNDEKIINYSNTTKFYKKRKIIDNKSIVKLYNEKIYIALEDGSYYAHWGDGYKERLGIIKSELNSHLDIAYNNGTIVFTYKRYRYSADCYAYLYVIIVDDENEEEHLRWAPGNENDNTVSSCIMKIDFNVINNFTPRTFPQGCYINNTDEFILVSWNEDGGYYGSYSGLELGVMVFRKLNGLYRNYMQKSIFNNLNSEPVFSSSICAYYMTNDGIFHFAHLPYTRLGQSPSHYVVPNFSTTYYVIRLAFTVEIVTTEYGTSLNIKTPTLSGNLVAALKNKDLINKNTDTYYDNKTIRNNNIFFNYGVLFSSILVENNATTNELVLAYSGELQSFVVLDRDDKDIDAGCCFFGDFKILINNGEISNISVCNRSNNYHGVILEDWNVTESIVIPSESDKIIYKVGSVFYEIRRVDEPILMLKNNQLVVNCNDELNCFDLIKQEILHYGSDWNCSFLHYGRYQSEELKFDKYPANSSGWLGAAINEFNRSYNPSILLNAKQVRLANSTQYLRECQTARDYYYNCAVNVYFGSDTAPLYNMSISIGVLQNPDLFGLNFPNDTNGNVLYDPNLFSDFISNFGVDVFVKNNTNVYQLTKEGQENVMAFYLGTLIENLETVFVLQGQYYGIINDQLFAFIFVNGVIAGSNFITNIQGLQYCGNTPYEALFYSKTNRCLYSFTGVNTLQIKQIVDKISIVKAYKYNPATQSIFLLTDIGVLVSSLFCIYCIDMPEAENMFLLDNGVVLCDNVGHYRYIRYYKEDTDEDYLKENIKLETCFYGIDNQTVTINDCLYMRLFSEEHEEGAIEVAASTISLKGRTTEKTTFHIKKADWDKETHTIYLRYQPKEQRGLGISFRIESPFKIASMSVGSQPDAILVDKVSKGAVNAPFNDQSSTIEW